MNDTNTVDNVTVISNRKEALENAKVLLTDVFSGAFENMKKREENKEVEVTSDELDDLIHELENENIVSTSNKPQSFWSNLKKSWNKPKNVSIKHRFQKLAGIVDNKTLAVLTLPTGVQVKFIELPSWKDVIKYKMCGFKYETFN